MSVPTRLRNNGLSSSASPSSFSHTGRKALTNSNISVVGSSPAAATVMSLTKNVNTSSLHNSTVTMSTTPLSRSRFAGSSSTNVTTRTSVDETEPRNLWPEPSTLSTLPQQQQSTMYISSQQRSALFASQKQQPTPTTPFSVKRSLSGKDVESQYVQGLEQQLALLDLETQYIYQQFNMGNKDVELEASLARHMKALRERCAAAVKSHKEQRDAMDSQVEDAKRRCVYMEKIIAQLKQDVNEANCRALEAKRACADDKTKLMTDSVRLQKETDKYKQTINSLQHEQDEFTNQIKVLSTSFIEKDLTITQLSQKLSDTEKEKAQLITLQQKCAQQAQQLEIHHVAPSEDLKITVETLKAQKQEAELLIQQKVLALAQAEQAREQAVIQCNAAMQRETQHLATVKRLQTDLNKESITAATLQKQLDEVQDKIQDSLRLQHELTYSQQHLLQANSVLEQTQKQAASASAENKRLQETKKRLVEEINLKAKENETLETANTQLTARFREASMELNKMAEQNSQLQTRVDELRDSLCKADAHAEVMHRKWTLASELDARLNSHEIMVLKDSAAQMTVTLDSLTRKLGNVEEPNVTQKSPISNVPANRAFTSAQYLLKKAPSPQHEEQNESLQTKTSPLPTSYSVHSEELEDFEEDFETLEPSPTTTPHSSTTPLPSPHNRIQMQSVVDGTSLDDQE